MLRPEIRNPDVAVSFAVPQRLPSAVVAVAAFLILHGCSAIRYVPDDRILYDGYKVQLEPEGRVRAKNSIRDLMDQHVSPKPNTKILGMRPGLWFYYIAGPATPEKKFRNFIRTRLGQVPIYMSDVDAERTSNLIQRHLVNNGFFQTSVRHETKIKGKKGTVIYTARVRPPYTLRGITYPDQRRLFADIDSIRGNSFLREGQRYDLERLQAEQTRIEEALENYGYYYFDDRHLLFEADSTVGERQVDLRLSLEKGVPERATTIYKIGTVTIFPDYSLSDDSVRIDTDTLRVDRYFYLDRSGTYKPHTITDVINLEPGNIYRRIDEDYTLSHLMSLGSFKFVDINFSERDSAVLDASIYLTPHLKKSIRGEFQLTSKSNNFVGPGLNVTFANRNFLGGSERFEIKFTSGYEVQISGKTDDRLNAFELGAESTLSIPRFVTPFRIPYSSRKYLPTTEVQLGFRLQQRISYFRLNSFNLAYGFSWRENSLKAHELYPVDISYMRLGKTSPVFQDLVDRNVFLKRSLENQFIMGARYAYTINSQVNKDLTDRYRPERFESHNFYLNGNLETAGNLMHLLKGGQFTNNIETDSTELLFGSAYSQFVRAEIDFRHYYQIDEHNKIASRIVAGAGYAYGNSVTMPYIRQFSVGGSNSIRAFPARSIGPGSYDFLSDPARESQTLFLDQRGDIKLEGSIEYRFDIIKSLKGALFVDAGNIWLWREDPQRPGSKLHKDRFLKQLAVGTGAGVRFDFNFFVLRFDVAFPLRKPYLPENDRWVLGDIDFGSSSWRGENIVLNIAIGYPF